MSPLGFKNRSTHGSKKVREFSNFHQKPICMWIQYNSGIFNFPFKTGLPRNPKQFGNLQFSLRNRFAHESKQVRESPIFPQKPICPRIQTNSGIFKFPLETDLLVDPIMFGNIELSIQNRPAQESNKVRKSPIFPQKPIFP